MSMESNSAALPPEQIAFSQDRYSRRNLMRLAAAGGISLAAMRLLSPRMARGTTPVSPSPDLSGGPSDGSVQFAAIPGNSINEKVLNFALTLEILEADLYRQALNLASDIPRDNWLNSNPAVYSQKIGGGGLSSSGTSAAYLYLKQFTYVEAAHRDFLIAAIKAAGFTPTKPNPKGYKFTTPLQPNLKNILTQILPLEETGVRAYLGALPYLTDLSYAQVAGSIYSTEARHSSVINYTLNKPPGPTKQPGDLFVVPYPAAGNIFEYYLEPKSVLAAASVYFV